MVSNILDKLAQRWPIVRASLCHQHQRSDGRSRNTPLRTGPLP